MGRAEGKGGGGGAGEAGEAGSGGEEVGCLWWEADAAVSAR
ncbi:MAG: hypothetical protein ACKERG_00580 [Candidatus Hodgkinia cicadicola]